MFQTVICVTPRLDVKRLNIDMPKEPKTFRHNLSKEVAHLLDRTDSDPLKFKGLSLGPPINLMTEKYDPDLEAQGFIGLYVTEEGKSELERFFTEAKIDGKNPYGNKPHKFEGR